MECEEEEGNLREMDLSAWRSLARDDDDCGFRKNFRDF